VVDTPASLPLLPSPGEFLDCPTEHSSWLSSSGKRLLDAGAAVILAILTLPLLAVAAVAVVVTSGRPVLYRQVRAGRDRKPFVVLKVRTMRRDAEAATGPVLAAAADPRVTRVGRLLRRTRIDELPQLYNVIRGEMSMVGPRPERPEFVQRFIREVPGYGDRFAALPGLTGPAQVFEPYDAGPASKIAHDLDYCRKASLAYDLRIMWLTVLTVLSAGGR